MDVVNVAQKLERINDHWNPRIAGELNGQQVKLAKLLGEFIWHHHEDEDEMFYVLSGELTMEFRDRTVVVKSQEFLIVPRGVEHRPVAASEVHLMLFEPAGTVNTGNAGGDKTRMSLEEI